MITEDEIDLIIKTAFAHDKERGECVMREHSIESFKNELSKQLDGLSHAYIVDGDLDEVKRRGNICRALITGAEHYAITFLTPSEDERADV